MTFWLGYATIHTLRQKEQIMPTFYFVQNVTYYLTVEAETWEQADEIAENTDVFAASVNASYTGWEEDGVAE